MQSFETWATPKTFQNTPNSKAPLLFPNCHSHLHKVDQNHSYFDKIGILKKKYVLPLSFKGLDETIQGMHDLLLQKTSLGV